MAERPARTGGKKYDVDMTQGNVGRHLVMFALPLLAGNIFQQFYNTVDTWVVGNFVSPEAFAAVGTVGPIINVLIGIFMGLSSGAGVVISRHYGAGDYEKVSQAVHTALTLTAILAAAFTAMGVFMTPYMLQLMKTDIEVVPQATTYLTIYFGGVAGLMFYNMGAGVLRAVGDSKRPFYYLVISAVLNIILDLLFVIVFHMGVAGVAWATIISQGISAVVTLFTLMLTGSCVRLELPKLRIHTDLLLQIVKVGIPASIQMAITAFSNVFVQSYINQFGKYAMGGWTAYNKIDQLVMLPMQSLALASTTFVGQNLGKGQAKRADQGVRTSLAMASSVTVVISLLVILLSPQLVWFFNKQPEVIEYGVLFLRWLTPFYVLCCLNQIYAGALRGAGNSTVPMIIMLFSFVIFRQCYLFIVSRFISNTVLPLAMGYPAGWLVCSVITLIYYNKVHIKALVEAEKAGEAA